VWLSALALFLLVTAQPWTWINGTVIGKVRGWVAPAPREWTLPGDDPHATHRRAAAAGAVASPLTVDQVIERIAPFGLDPPVRLYLPNEHQPRWRVRSETQNRPRVRELTLDRMTGELLRDDGFADKSALDKAIHVGIAAHEGQLFGLANQLLGFATALGLLTLCVSALVMWWRRRPGGSLGIPAPRVAEFRVGAALWIAIVALGLLLPVLGLSIVLLALLDGILKNRRHAPAGGDT
jgi:uncharacterized iron-regulated membrane protein